MSETQTRAGSELADAPILQISKVSVQLSGRPVLENVNLCARAGEVLALLGPNGAGKTTLLRTMLTLLRPSSGQILISGVPAAKAAKTKMGYVPQRHDFAWDFPISVGEVVLTGITAQLPFARRAKAAHWRQVAQALERVKMLEFAQRPVAQLSGGQRQRVLVARALVNHPDVLLLDEPYTALDMPSQELLGEVFKNLAREGAAVVMTTHDISQALFSVDQVALLNRTIIASGTPREIAAKAEPWMRAYEVSESSSLVQLLSAF